MHDSARAIQIAAEIAVKLVREEDSLPTPPPPRLEPADAMRLPIGLPATGAEPDEVVRRLQQVVEATPSSSNRRAFAQLFGGRDPASTMGDIVAVVMNSSMYTFKAAGVQVLIEREITNRMAQMAGFPDGEGVFAPGGSMSNFAAMLIAREEKLPGTREEGVNATSAPGGRATVYTSADAHYSIAKSMNMLGLGRANLRKIATDTDGRMDPAELKAQIEIDLAAGMRPIMIIATAGTTVRGAFDPLPELAAVARAFDLWLHVDGAFGGSVLFSDKHRHLMEGSELADSLVWDAHKVLGAPLTCSVALTKQRGLFEKHIGEDAEYLFQEDDAELNPGTRSLQCGRRNDALKLWCAWQAHGDAGYAARIDRLFDNARLMRDIVVADPELVLSCEPQSMTVCFEVTGRSSVDICEWLDHQGLLKVSYGIVNERAVVRMVSVNPEMTEADIREAIEAIKAAGRALPRQDNDVQELESQAEEEMAR